MTELPKRLVNSHRRIAKRGGVILVHHGEGGATHYQLQDGGNVSPNVVAALVAAKLLECGKDGLFGGDDQTFHVVNA